MNLVQMISDLAVPAFKTPALSNAVVLDGGGRRSRTGWINLIDNQQAFYYLQDLVQRANVYYSYDLDLLTIVQYAEYREGDFYLPHIDLSLRHSMSASKRKLSFSLILNPSEFTGGELQFMQDPGLPEPPENNPYAVFFPSFVMHGVAPVKTGVRKSLVGWVTGPAFR